MLIAILYIIEYNSTNFRCDDCLTIDLYGSIGTNRQLNTRIRFSGKWKFKILPKVSLSRDVSETSPHLVLMPEWTRVTFSLSLELRAAD
jgi:hypothetical protein